MEPATIAILSKDYLSNAVSQVVVYGLHLALPAAIACIALISFIVVSARARSADAQFRDGPPRGPGRAAVRGRVEFATGSPFAVRVSIEQVGEERKTKNGWTHEWRETQRRVDAAPFYLRGQNGERLRVEPDGGVVLIDDPSSTIPGGMGRRTRVVELSPGEEVYAIGALQPGHDPEARVGYRDPRGVLVLRRPSLQEPLMLSSGPLGDHIRRERGVHLAAMIASAVFVVVFQIADVGFHIRTLVGEPTVGQVTHLERVTGKNSACVLTVRAPDGDEFSEDVSYDWCGSLHSGVQVPIVHVPGWSFFSQVGKDAGVSAAALIAWLPFFGLFLVAYALGRPKPWWRARLVESGNGRLPAS